MLPSRLSPLSAVILLALAGCAMPPPQGVTSRLSLAERSQVIGYAFGGACSGSIGSGHRKAVSAFLHKNADPATDLVVVSVPRGCNAHADRARADAARKMVSSWHGPVRLQAAEPGDLRSIRGIVKIAHVEGIAVDRTGCRDGLGCANASNLAAMIADPRDLYRAEGAQTYRNRPNVAGSAN